jgi:hypothetical protein
VTVEQNGPRPQFRLAFSRVDVAGANPVNAPGTSNLTVTLAAGEYRLSAIGLPAGYMLKSATIGTVDAVSQTFKIAPGSPTALAITLGVSSPPPWVKVSGHVIGGNATR